MRKLLFISCFIIALCMVQSLHAQSISDSASSRANTHADTVSYLKEVQRIEGSYTNMAVDVLGNIYLLTPATQLKKLNAAGDSVAVYNNLKELGRPELLSVSNPLQLVVYYPGFKTVVLLDRLLAEKGRLNFRTRNLFSISAVAAAYDNNLWAFDDQNMQLKKISAEGDVLLATNDVRTFLQQAPSPDVILDADNVVALYDAESGFYIFDRYGTFNKTIAVKNLVGAGATGNYVYGFSNNMLHFLNITTGLERNIPFVTNGMLAAAIVNNRVYLLSNDGVRIFEF